MAERIVSGNNGAPMSDGNGGTTNPGTTQTQGGGSSTSTNVPGTGGSGTAGGGTGGSNGGGSNTPSAPTPSDKEKEVKDILAKYLEVSAILYAFEEVVDIYMEYKLGFGKDGEALKKKYKEENTDISPEDVDQAVEEEIEATKKALKDAGEAAGEEIKKKYEEFKTASFEAKKNLISVIKKSINVTTEAAMPPVVGPVAPNPVSMGLKLYNGLSNIKAVIDRAVIALTLFMAAAESLGINNTAGYKSFIELMHSVLKPAMAKLKETEGAAAKAQDPDLAAFTEEAKKSYKTTGLQGQVLGYKGIEDMAKNEFEIYMYPLTEKELKKLYNIINVKPAVSAIPGIGVIVAFADVLTTTDKERRAVIVMEYNNHLVRTVNEMMAARDSLSQGTPELDLTDVWDGQFFTVTEGTKDASVIGPNGPSS